MEKTVAVIEKNQIEEIRVALSKYQGHDLVGVRIWANYDSANSEKRPTKKGVNLRVDKLPKLITALREAESQAIEAGLLAPADQAA